MKIEFENSIRRLNFLCHLTDTKIAWINPWSSEHVIFENYLLWFSRSALSFADSKGSMMTLLLPKQSTFLLKRIVCLGFILQISKRSYSTQLTANFYFYMGFLIQPFSQKREENQGIFWMVSLQRILSVLICGKMFKRYQISRNSIQ